MQLKAIPKLMLVDKVVGEKEEISARLYGHTSDTCVQVNELLWAKGLVSRITCKLVEFPSVWKNAKLSTP